jgi:hypothetical protein
MPTSAIMRVRPACIAVHALTWKNGLQRRISIRWASEAAPAGITAFYACMIQLAAAVT